MRILSTLLFYPFTLLYSKSLSSLSHSLKWHCYPIYYAHQQMKRAAQFPSKKPLCITDACTIQPRKRFVSVSLSSQRPAFPRISPVLLIHSPFTNFLAHLCPNHILREPLHSPCPTKRARTNVAFVRLFFPCTSRFPGLYVVVLYIVDPLTPSALSKRPFQQALEHFNPCTCFYSNDSRIHFRNHLGFNRRFKSLIRNSR